MSKPVCIIWMNEAGVYTTALERAGIAGRFELHGIRRDQTIPEELLPRCEILLGWHPAPGLLARMPKLRWIQSSTAGMEQWLTDPGLRDDIILTCGRGSHRVQMPENILAALFFLTKPYTQCVIDQHVRAPRGQDAGHPRSRRDRAGTCAQGGCPRNQGDRH
jgi:glyoxylate/hydroxypyruvate reductase A